MCSEVVKECPWSLIYFPDHYLRLQEMWCEYYLYVVTPEPWHYDDKLIEWCNGYKKCRALKKKQIDRVLLCVEWQPLR